MSVTYTLSKPVQALKGEQLTVPASNGTKTVFNRRPGFNGILLEPTLALRLGLVPRITGLWRKTSDKWINLLATPGSTIIDRGFTGQSLALRTTDYLYVGFVRKVNDLFVDIGATANATGSVLTCANSTLTGFVALTITVDGTDSGGATFAQDGNITFTVPTAWTPESLRDLLGDSTAPVEKLYWLRFAVSVNLDAATLVDQLAGFIETDGAGTDTGDTGFFGESVLYEMSLGDEVGALQFIAQAAAATTVQLTWVRC